LAYHRVQLGVPFARRKASQEDFKRMSVRHVQHAPIAPLQVLGHTKLSGAGRSVGYAARARCNFSARTLWGGAN
jgi:hypothetical protein